MTVLVACCVLGLAWLSSPVSPREVNRVTEIGPGASSTPIVDETKISSGVNGGPVVDDDDRFGEDVAAIGDVDGDGINDLVVGARNDGDGGVQRGAVYVLFMNTDGTARASQKISDTAGGFTATLDDADYFGRSVAGLGDVDGDGTPDIAVTASLDDDGGTDRGAVYVLFLNADGTVKAEQKISDTTGGLTATLDDLDEFGKPVAEIGDLDGDGINDIAVGSAGDDDGGTDRGAVYVLFLNTDGTVKAEQKISDTTGGLTATLDDADYFSESVAGLGDLDGDGINDIAVGSVGDDDGGTDRGAVYVLFLNTDGTVKAEQKISDTVGNFTATLDDWDRFGASTANLGDIDGDGINDIAVSAFLDNDGGADRGAVYLLTLNADGTVKAHEKISDTEGGLTATLDDSDWFGDSVAGLGDLDGDGAVNLAIGAPLDDDGGADRGALYILDLTALVDSDGDGLWNKHEDANTDADNNPTTTPGPDTDGDTLPNYLDADDDGDGTPTASENADPNADGDPRDALDTDHDGQPDYLDVEAGPSTTPIAAEQKISDTEGGLSTALADFDQFGSGVAAIGDVDGDGVNDVAVGARFDDDGGNNRGAVYVLFLNADGTVKAEQKISDTAGGLTATLDDAAAFGNAVAEIGDLDGDGIPDIAVGAAGDSDGGTERGAVYVLFLNADGTVKAEQKISDIAGGLTATLDDDDYFGSALSGVGDLDGDGINDIAVGADSDDDGGTNRGAVYVLFLNADGTVKAEQKISGTAGGLTATLHGLFGSGIAGIGDLDGDGIPDLAVGAPLDDDGGGNYRGAVYILFMNANGTVKGEQKISEVDGGLAATLDDFGYFGNSVSGIGDLDGDGNHDIVVGANGDNGGASSTGAVYVLSLQSDGTVAAEKVISGTQGGLTGPLDSLDQFGWSVAGLGDLDGDGALDIAVGATGDDDGGGNYRGAVYILDLLGYLDSDGDGLWDRHEDANTDADNDPATSPGPDTDGDTLPNYLDADDDGDSTPTASENADPNADGNPRDALDVDRDGQPDYLDLPTGANEIIITSEQKISDTAGGLVATLDNSDEFGREVSSIGDIDGDGVVDIAVGAVLDGDGGTYSGAIYILFLNPDGTVKAEQKISGTVGGLVSNIDSGDYFGKGLASLGDLDGDGVPDIAASANGDDDGAGNSGATYVLFLNTDGTVKAEQKISNSAGGLTTTLSGNDDFGSALTSPGDIDGDGVNDLVVGAKWADDGGGNAGEVYVLLLNTDGTVKGEQKISTSAGGLSATLVGDDNFGDSVAGVGDLDGDGVPEVVVGASGDNGGGSARGAVYILFLNADGTVKAEQKISYTTGGLAPTLDSVDYFGAEAAGTGDVDGDGVPDVVVGAYADDDGGPDRGALYLLLLNTDGTVKAQQKISDLTGGFTATLNNHDNFGLAVSGLGDLDGDGAINLAVGARGDDDGGTDRGAVYVLDLLANLDSDGDGLWDRHEDANTDADDDPATSPGPDTDGDTLPNYLDADDDGDGTPTASENADPNVDGDPRDALDADRDRQPDYLDAPTLETTGSVADEQKISSTAGGLTGPLDDQDDFGAQLSAIGDLDGDGIVDLAVGAEFDDDGGTGRGAIYVLLMNGDGTVKAEQKISELEGGLTAALVDGDAFGSSVSGIGDLDGDGVEDIVVGARADDDGSTNAGAIYVLFMNPDGTVKAEQKISDTAGGLSTTLGSTDFFGASVSALGDLDADGIGDLAVGARLDDDGGSSRGAVYILFLNPDGTVKAEQKISDTTGGLAATLANSDSFGSSVSGIGDLDGDGIGDLAVGARGDNGSSTDEGAAYVLFLNANGTVKAEQKISNTDGGFTGGLANGDYFGESVSGVGDLDADGIGDLVVGAPGTTGGAADEGAIYLLFMNANGTVKAEQKIAEGTGGLGTTLDIFDTFGYAVAGLGDLDGDGLINLAVGVPDDDDGGAGRGAVYVLDLAALVDHCAIDSDSDGLWDCEEDANTDADGDPATSPGPDTDGDTTPNYLDADDDGDGTLTSAAAEAADPDGDGDPRDALDTDHDGQPDYLDLPTGASDATVIAEQKISDTQGGFTATLAFNANFATSLASIGDIDGDGVNDLAVGAIGDNTGGAAAGAVYILFLNTDGTVRADQKITESQGGFTTALDSSDSFGASIAGIGDLDGDGINDIAVGAPRDDGPGASDRGAIYVLLLNADGTVKAEQKISDSEGGFTTTLDGSDKFGASLTALGDLDGDGINDIAVGAPEDDDGTTNAGSVYVLFMNADGTVKSEQKISDTQGGFTTTLDGSDDFGSSITALGDLDGDGINDIAVGAREDDDGAFDGGAVYILLLNANGTVKAEQKVTEAVGGFTAVIDTRDYFGASLTGIGDLDGDGTSDLVVGAPEDDDGSIYNVNRGAVYILFLNPDGTVDSHQKISDTEGNLTTALGDSDFFGSSVAGIGDRNGDGAIDLAVGAPDDDDGDLGHGGLYILDLAPLSSVVQANPDTASTFRNQTTFVDASANDNDTDGDPITEVDASTPTNGTAAVNGAGTVSYTPATNYTGPDSFEYWAIDSGSGLTHYWGLAGDGLDAVGGTDGTLTGATTIVGDFGEALSFDEVDDRVAIPDFAYGADFTLSFDFKLDDNTGSLVQYVYSHGDINSASSSVNVYFVENAHPTDPDVIRTVVRDANDTLDNVALEHNIAGLVGDGLWHTYTLTTSTSNGLTVYLDGVEIASDSTRGTDGVNPIGSAYFGSRHDMDADRFYGGGVDSVQVYARALPSAEVADLADGINRSTVTLTVAPCPDSDSDGLEDCEEDANTDADNDPATNPGPDTDADAVPNYLDADDDGDGTPTASENADPNGDGDPRDALDSDRDGQPDYLDPPATSPTTFTVGDEQKISDTQGGLVAPLDNSDGFGSSVSSIGDLDGDGIVDIAVGALFDDDGGAARGAVHVLFMNADGTVRAEQKISSTSGGLSATLDDADSFGAAVAGLGDVDGDGVMDIAVGAYGDDDGASAAGAVHMLFLNPDGTVKAEQKISDTEGGFATTLDSFDFFGSALSAIGDLDGDGINDIAVGARLDDDGGTSRGAVYILLLNSDGTVKAEQKISDTAGGFTATLDNSDFFGTAVSGVGDLDGDGIVDLAVGSRGDDDGGTDRGAFYMLFLNTDGTVKAEQKASETAGGFTVTLDDGDSFGAAVSGVGDVDGDAIMDLVVGAYPDDDGGTDSGAVYIVLLNTDGTVKAEHKISDTSGGFTGPLDLYDEYGWSVSGVGDLDGDGTIGFVVGSFSDDDGGSNRGAVYVLDLAMLSPIDDASIRRSDLVAIGVDTDSPVDGVAADALSYEGSSDRLVGPATDITSGAWTLSGWVNATSFGTDPRIAAKASSDGNAVYELLIDDTSASTGLAMARLRLGGTTHTVSGGAVGTGSWHQLAATWDGVTLSLYVDGAVVDSTSAAGTIATDVTVPLTVGNLAAADRPFEGIIDEVRLSHSAASAERLGFEQANLTNPTTVVSVGAEQTAAAAPWTITGSQTRSGSNAASAPTITSSSADAWLTATGIDEPGIEFTTWWWMSTVTGVDFAAGTRAGAVPTNQYETAITSSSGWDLATHIGGARTQQVVPTGSPLLSQWVQVTIRTDENGTSSVWIEGTEVIADTAQGSGLLSGTAALRAGQVPSGQSWYVDDARARKLISAEPSVSLGPLERR